jgi:predicted transposase YbfD/YdcC
LLSLKDNHPDLCKDVSLWLDHQAEKLPAHETVEKDHGRIEIRKYILSDQIGWLRQKKEWKGLMAVGRVESTIIIGTHETTERQYYLVSFNDLDRFSQAARNHWAIENSQYWVLDVQFSEDQSRARKDYSAENLALVRRMVLNIIRANDPSKKA